jgi:hypothetical protein
VEEGLVDFAFLVTGFLECFDSPSIIGVFDQKAVQERLAWLVKLVCPWHEPSDFREMTSRSIP